VSDRGGDQPPDDGSGRAPHQPATGPDEERDAGADEALDGGEEALEDGDEAPHGRDEARDSGDEETPGTGGSDALLGRGMFTEAMGPGSSMAHLYRAEVHRMKLWRERLDRTTNWAVVLMAAILTWAFSSETNPHYILLVGIAAVTVFLLIEARRYRGYDMWRTRVRLLQENVLAVALDESLEPPDPDWRAKLSRDYLAPTMKLTTGQAIAHRLRRVYLPLFGVLFAAWVVRITAFAVDPWPESAAVGRIPGVVVTALVAVFALLLVVVAYRPREWEGELFEDGSEGW